MLVKDSNSVNLEELDTKRFKFGLFSNLTFLPNINERYSLISTNNLSI